MRYRASAALALLAAVALAGCDSVAYYTQALRGQVELWRATRPVEQVMADPRSSVALKERLALAGRIREFASRELGLPDNASYRGYADLMRPYVVWNVFAAEALSVTLKQWCFPVAGCVAYKGYFDKAQAEQAAAALRRDGFDVFVGGVPAYSTLGYLDDPLLSTFINYPPTELARLIFHELAHQVAYARDDSVFNESFAVTVEREGLRRWLKQHGTERDRRILRQSLARRAAFNELASKYRSKLESIYASDLPNARKLAAKATVFGELAAEYARLKASWGGFAGYDRWYGEHPNNATLASIAVYTQQVPAFEALLARLGGDLPRFYAEVRRLAAEPKDERMQSLAALATGH